MRRPVVGDCCGGDEDVGARDFALHGLQHVCGAFHVHTPHARRRRQAHRAGHQHDLGAGRTRRRGHGKSHLAAAAIADEAHGIDALARRAGRQQHAHTDQRLRHGGLAQRDGTLGQIQRLEHAALADLAAGLVTFTGSEDRDAARAQRGDVRLGGGVRPHLAVHGWRHGDWRGGCETDGGEQIARLTGGEPCDQIGRGRRNHDEIGPAREFDVAHRRLGARVPQFIADIAAGHGLEGHRRDELRGAGGHHHLHLRAALTQPAHEVRRLVRSNSRADADDDAFAGQAGSHAVHTSDYQWRSMQRANPESPTTAFSPIRAQIAARRRGVTRPRWRHGR